MGTPITITNNEFHKDPATEAWQSKVDKLLADINGSLTSLSASQTALAAAVQEIHSQDTQTRRLIMQELEDLTQDVANEKTVVAGAVTLLGGIAARLDAAGTDKAKLAALSTDLRAQTQSLAAAIASVPADPNTVVDPNL